MKGRTSRKKLIGEEVNEKEGKKKKKGKKENPLQKTSTKNKKYQKRKWFKVKKIRYTTEKKFK